ncbi:MFS transporter [Modestobacter sp. SSW1-42]|uniref:MFS transporter n=1 Tax=Modestobacter sp. SSW1-42 TaxID=596372 RepID=UPI003987E362
MTVATDPDTRQQRGVLTAVVLTALNLRTAVTGFSVLLGTAGDALRFGQLVAGAIGTIVTACFAVAAFAAPALVRRLGLERTAALALTATTVGIVLRALAWSPAALLGASVLLFAGVGASNVVLIPIVKTHFPTRVRTLSTVYMVLLQVGQLVAPLVALALATVAGWRTASGVWALFTAVAAVLWIRAARDRAARDRAPGAPAGPRPAGRGVHQRTPLALGLIGLMAMTTLHVYTLITWLPTMYTDAGVGETSAAFLLSWFAGLGLVAAFVVPPLAGRLANPYPVVVVCAALMAVGYLGMLTAPQTGALAWATAFGLGVSTFPLCLTLIGLRTADPAAASALSGLVQGIGYGIGCIGPLALGALDQATGSWRSTYLVLAATLVITLAAGWWACRPPSVPARRG